MDADEQRRLVEAARSGDGDAWEALYRNVHSRLRAYVVRRVGSMMAEDVMSETLTRAVAGFERFRWEAAGFDGWLFGIARHVCSDVHRSSSRNQKLARRAQFADVVAEPSEALVRADEHSQIRRLFALLSPSDRELLELRVLAGLSAEQAAKVLGRRPGAVRTAQSRALARLRILLESDDT